MKAAVLPCISGREGSGWAKMSDLNLFLYINGLVNFSHGGNTEVEKRRLADSFDILGVK